MYDKDCKMDETGDVMDCTCGFITQKMKDDIMRHRSAHQNKQKIVTMSRKERRRDLRAK